MANGKIVKYKKIYTITIEGKTDTKYPDDKPSFLVTSDEYMNIVFTSLCLRGGAWNKVKINSREYINGRKTETRKS